MIPVHGETRGSSPQDPHAHLRIEPLRDQLFAACGYAFVIAAPVTELLTAHLGRLALVTGIALIAVLVPVNLTLIRRYARLRRLLASHHTAALAWRGDKATSRQRTSQD